MYCENCLPMRSRDHLRNSLRMRYWNNFTRMSGYFQNIAHLVFKAAFVKIEPFTFCVSCDNALSQGCKMKFENFRFSWIRIILLATIYTEFVFVCPGNVLRDRINHEIRGLKAEIFQCIA